MIHIQRQNAKSHKILDEGATWFDCLSDLHKDNPAKKALFSDLAETLRNLDDKLFRDLRNLADKELIDANRLSERITK